MMKRKENFRIGRKNLTVVVLAFVLVISAMLTACGSSAAETTPATKEEVVVDNVEEKTTEEVAQTETVEEVESTEEVAGPQSVFEWSAFINASEPILTIWNDVSKEGKIIENEQKCILKEGDLLVVCMQEKESNIQFLSPVKCESYGSEIYKVLDFTQEFSEETLYEFIMTVAGVEYPFSVTLISEGAEDNGVETNTEDNLIGKEWAATLDYDEVKLLIWNYDNGKKEVVDINGEAIIENEDILAIYCPDRYWVNTVLPVSYVDPIEICEGLCPLPSYKCTLLEEIAYERKGSTNLEVELMTASDYEYYNFIVTIQ